MNKFEVIIYWSEADSAYIAEMPELPGCMADGATAGEALQNIEQVARELNRPIPEPKGRLRYA